MSSPRQVKQRFDPQSAREGRKDVAENMGKEQREQLVGEKRAGEAKENDLHPELQAQLEVYRKSRAFDADEWIQNKCKTFNDYMAKCGLKGCCVSLSGGVDSACTFALMKHASKMPGSPIGRVVGISQPIHSSGWALERAQECAKVLDAELIVVDQTALHDQLIKIVDSSIGIEGNKFSTGQLRSYQRAPVQYYVAQLISQAGHPCLVMGTGNKDEDGYLGYFCKAGDGVVDLQLLSDLHKSEVFTISEKLGVPDSILKAAPSADLWDGQTDENELGFSYDFIELFTGAYVNKSAEQKVKFLTGLSEEAKTQFLTWGQKCAGVHNRNAHKLNGVVNL